MFTVSYNVLFHTTYASNVHELLFKFANVFFSTIVQKVATFCTIYCIKNPIFRTSAKSGLFFALVQKTP